MLLDEALSLNQEDVIEAAIEPYTSWSPAEFIEHIAGSEFLVKSFGHHYVVRPVQIRLRDGQ